MRKTKWFILSAVIALIVTASVCLVGCAGDISDKEYLNYVSDLTLENGEKLFNGNTVDSAMPQTVNYAIVEKFLSDEYDSKGKQKKVLFLGYDGYRADGLENIMNNKPEDSAVMDIRSKGKLYYTYSGGFKDGNTQATSTAPSWAAMLTGGWGDYNGISDNNQMKNEESTTFIEYALSHGYTASFDTSWREHTQKSYFNDITRQINEYGADKVRYTHHIDDEDTLYKVLEYTSRPEETKDSFDPDVLFLTLEHADHAGHDITFGNHIEEYVQATKDADRFGRLILDSIYSRATYAEEDWLIIVTTDHGGQKRSHGMQSDRARTTWLSCNKPELVEVEAWQTYARKPVPTIEQG